MSRDEGFLLTAYPEVPWKLIAGTRDRLIHHYGSVDLEEVRRMLTTHLPRLIRFLEGLALGGS